MKEPSTTTHDRYAAIVDAFMGNADVSFGSLDKRGFGSTALKVGDKIFAMLDSRGSFVVKLPRQRVDALVAAGAGQRFGSVRGRPMKEWFVAASPESAECDGATPAEEWLRLAREALEFVAGQR